jgi:DNA-binding MarR family transcriptional regulator
LIDINLEDMDLQQLAKLSKQAKETLKKRKREARMAAHKDKVPSHSLPEEQLKVMRAIALATETFMSVRREMPLQYLRSFLLVVMYPGKSVIEYARLAGVSQTVMSRHLLDIGDRARDRSAGFGLVTTRPNPWNQREKQVLLTEKGKQIAHKMARALTNTHHEQHSND